jgi:Flp pilus assembly protein TadG
LKKIIINQKKADSRHQIGVAILEFAIIGLVVFSLIFGVIYYALYIFNLQVLTNASREGARAAVVSAISKQQVASATDCSRSAISAPTTTTAQLVATCVANAYVQNYLVSFVAPGTSGITSTTVSSSGTCANPPSNTCFITVTTSQKFGALYLFGNSASTISSTTRMYYE